MTVGKASSLFSFLLLVLVFASSCSTSPKRDPNSPICTYGERGECKSDEICINVDVNQTACIKKYSQKPVVIKFPFMGGVNARCDQGALTPRGESHTWLNTAYATDLQSDSIGSYIVAGVDGKAIVYNECQTENDQCGAGFGNHVKILTQDNYVVHYAHLHRALVQTGQEIKAGQTIGIEGSTGWTGQDNRHLHLSVHFNWIDQGFDYWMQLGSLPVSVPFELEACSDGCARDCKKKNFDVREIKCSRTSKKPANLCSR